VELHISESGYKEGETPTEPTPDVYSQILDKLKNLQAGEISDEQISKAINEYLAENPDVAAEVEEKIRVALQGGTLEGLGEENMDEDGLIITEEFSE
jgi:hypothetical protein